MPEGPYAVFWGTDRTFVLDVSAPQLWVAKGLYATTADGSVWRYRLRTASARPRVGRGELPSPASRWTVFEGGRVGARAYLPLTTAPTLPSRLDEVHRDERAVLKFMGDRVDLARFTRHLRGGHITETRAVQTLDLPSGEVLPIPEGARAALEFFAESMPHDMPSTVPSGVLGDADIGWLAVGPKATLYPLGARSPRSAELHGAHWDGHQLHPDQGDTVPSVADARPLPDEDGALLLLGDPIQTPAVAPGPLSLTAPCARRRLTLWRPDRSSDRRLVDLGAVQRLDGLRWLAPGDPLLAYLDTHFLSADAPTCTGALTLATPRYAGHICAIDDDARRWSGPADLSAEVTAYVEDDTLRLEVRVTDPGRSPKDAVFVYFGGARPTRISVDAKGLHVKGSRRTRRALKRRIKTARVETDDGYQVTVLIPMDVWKHPRLTVRVRDADPGLDGGAISLWAAGHRIDARQGHATKVLKP